MKVLSIQQPWAWLILNAGKDIENRRWPTAFRGRFLVHAGMTFDLQAWMWLRENGHTISEKVMWMPEDQEEFKRGGIVGSVELVDCVLRSQSRWAAKDQFHFVLRDPRAETFTPLKGRLGFFNVPWPAIAADPAWGLL